MEQNETKTNQLHTGGGLATLSLSNPYPLPPPSFFSQTQPIPDALASDFINSSYFDLFINPCDRMNYSVSQSIEGKVLNTGESQLRRNCKNEDRERGYILFNNPKVSKSGKVIKSFPIKQLDSKQLLFSIYGKTTKYRGETRDYTPHYLLTTYGDTTLLQWGGFEIDVYHSDTEDNRILCQEQANEDFSKLSDFFGKEFLIWCHTPGRFGADNVHRQNLMVFFVLDSPLSVAEIRRLEKRMHTHLQLSPICENLLKDNHRLTRLPGQSYMGLVGNEQTKDREQTLRSVLTAFETVGKTNVSKLLDRIGIDTVETETDTNNVDTTAIAVKQTKTSQPKQQTETSKDFDTFQDMLTYHSELLRSVNGHIETLTQEQIISGAYNALNENSSKRTNRKALERLSQQILNYMAPRFKPTTGSYDFTRIDLMIKHINNLVGVPERDRNPLRLVLKSLETQDGYFATQYVITVFGERTWQRIRDRYFLLCGEEQKDTDVIYMTHKSFFRNGGHDNGLGKCRKYALSDEILERVRIDLIKVKDEGRRILRAKGEGVEQKREEEKEGETNRDKDYSTTVTNSNSDEFFSVESLEQLFDPLGVSSDTQEPQKRKVRIG